MIESKQVTQAACGGARAREPIENNDFGGVFSRSFSAESLDQSRLGSCFSSCMAIDADKSGANMPLSDISAARMRTMSDEVLQNGVLDEEDLLLHSDHGSRHFHRSSLSPTVLESSAAPGLWEQDLSTQLQTWRELGPLLSPNTMAF